MLSLGDRLFGPSPSLLFIRSGILRCLAGELLRDSMSSLLFVRLGIRRSFGRDELSKLAASPLLDRRGGSRCFGGEWPQQLVPSLLRVRRGSLRRLIGSSWSSSVATKLFENCSIARRVVSILRQPNLDFLDESVMVLCRDNADVSDRRLLLAVDESLFVGRGRKCDFLLLGLVAILAL